MALLWIDGFDGAEATNDDAGTTDTQLYLTRMYESTNVNDTTRGPRVKDGWFGTKSLSFGDDGFGDTYWIRKTIPETGTVIFGFAFNMTGWLQSAGGAGRADLIARVRHVADGAEHLRVYILNKRHIRIQTPSVILGHALNCIRSEQFCYLEFKFAISDTVGTVDVRVNGINYLSLTNQDTRNGGSGDDCDTIELVGVDGNLGSTNDNSQGLFDDFYICDTTGSTNNNFIGPLKVEEIVPDGAGNSAQFTPSTGSNWQNVDETPADDSGGSGTYNTSATANNKDTHTMSALTNIDGTIYGVQVDSITRVVDATTHTHTNIVRRSTSEANGAAPTISSTSYVAVSDMFEQDPAAGPGAWTVTNVNAMEAGYEVD
jgi:hypothetical protein